MTQYPWIRPLAMWFIGLMLVGNLMSNFGLCTEANTSHRGKGRPQEEVRDKEETEAQGRRACKEVIGRNLD